MGSYKWGYKSPIMGYKYSNISLNVKDPEMKGTLDRDTDYILLKRYQPP